jgi:hypothetical protein
MFLKYAREVGYLTFWVVIKSRYLRYRTPNVIKLRLKAFYNPAQRIALGNNDNPDLRPARAKKA